MPYQEITKLENSQQILNSTQAYYKQRYVSVKYFIDQINTYYSIVTENSMKQQPKRITHLISKVLKDQNIIFASSENIDTAFLFEREYNYIDVLTYRDIATQKKKLSNQKRNLSFEGIKEIIKIIIFEYQKLGYQQFIFQDNLKYLSNFFNAIDRLQEIPKFQQKCVNNQSFLSQITHQKISACFLQSSKQLLQDLVQCFKCQDNQIFWSFMKFFQTLHAYNIEKQGNKYKNFLTLEQSHQSSCSRLLIALQMKNKAIQRYRQSVDQEIKVTHFEYQTYGGENDLRSVNMDHTDFLPKDNKLIIYYSPDTFIKITNFLIGYATNKLQPYYKKFVQNFSHNKGWIGQILDSSPVYLLTRAKVCLNIQNQQFIIRNYCQKQPKCCPFWAFMNIKQEKSIKWRFKDALTYLENDQGNKGESWICTAPYRKYQNSSEPMSNSQVIDCLMLKTNNRINNLYEMITFDFTVSANKEAINDKISRAKKFMDIFNQNLKIENNKKMSNNLISFNGNIIFLFPVNFLTKNSKIQMVISKSFHQNKQESKELKLMLKPIIMIGINNVKF